jgi:tripartite-type tricarboxylate transporter receptor subunit TctC
MHIRRAIVFATMIFSAAFVSLFSSLALGESYPTRTVTIIAPFAAGGPSDLVARILASGLQKVLGQSFVVDNRPGAGGNVGVGVASRAVADGYTLLLGSSAMSVNAAMFKNLAYDPIKDFVPISELAVSTNVIVTRPDSPFTTLASLVDFATKNPGKLNYASAGAGSTSHLTGELLKIRGGVDIQHVPYRGAAPAVRAVIEGTTEIAVVAIPAAEELIRSSQLRALAVTGTKRWHSMPDVPTALEAGIPDFVSETWSGLFAPTGTRLDVIEKLSEASQKAMRTPEAQAASLRAGVTVVGTGPEDFKQRYLADIAKIKDLVEKAGIPRN